jgi:hypothetical protein
MYNTPVLVWSRVNGGMKCSSGNSAVKNFLTASALPEDDPIGSKHVAPILIVILMF